VGTASYDCLSSFMISVDQATAITLSHLFSPPVLKVPLRDAVNHVLATPVFADRDFPPFDRVTMDGVAIAYKAWEEGRRTFVIAGVQGAGASQMDLPGSEVCIEVMTGAVLPRGADTVIRYEDLTMNNGMATVADVIVEKYQNVHHRGSDAAAGSALLSPGQRISPAEVALMASVGITSVDVRAWPRVAVLSSGDELVAVEEQPGPFQIRRSNTEALVSALRSMGIEAEAGHLPDDADIIKREIGRTAAECDVMILSGGVSKGKYDYIPDALEAAGIRKLFHQVSQRPGKPFWFGVGSRGPVAFALPGNPVSTFMCFYRYVRPWLLHSLGTEVKSQAAVLAEDFKFAPALTYFLQVRVSGDGGVMKAWPAAGGGSGDFANLASVDGFLELPSDREVFRAGEVFPFLAFRP
jgi:molybdopterin molybdotransferase